MCIDKTQTLHIASRLCFGEDFHSGMSNMFQHHHSSYLIEVLACKATAAAESEKEQRTHAKGNCGGNDLHFVMCPVVLRLLTLLSRHHGMVRPVQQQQQQLCCALVLLTW